MSQFYEFKMTDAFDDPFDFASLEGKVVLVVNTATK